MKTKVYWIFLSLCAVGALVLSYVFYSSQQSAPTLATNKDVQSTPYATATPQPSVPSIAATPSQTLGTYTPPATVPPAPVPEKVALPVSISIPDINVTSDLLRLGLNADGTLQVPSGNDYNKAGWYENSVTPGSIGPAIIAGHIDSVSNGPSVFFNLAKLTPGQRIDITREDGSVVSYAVDHLEQHSKNDFPTREVYGNTENSQIRLITCGGSFSSTSGHYSDNIIVYASLV